MKTMNDGGDAAERIRMNEPDRWVRHHVIPFAIFMVFLLLSTLAGTFFKVDLPSQPWWRMDPNQWIYPLQTVVCLVVLIWWWRSYEFSWSWKWSWVGVIFGVVGIGFWLLPTTLHAWLDLPDEKGHWWHHLGVAARRDGFDPGAVFGEGSAEYWTALTLRFVRAAVVVALVEEIFWRSYVMRLVVDWEGDYWKRPFGEASVKSYLIVTGLFMLAHAPVDYLGAWVYGSMTYLLCVWSKNLGACVVMHFVANLLMGIYAVSTGKFGLW